MVAADDPADLKPLLRAFGPDHVVHQERGGAGPLLGKSSKGHSAAMHKAGDMWLLSRASVLVAGSHTSLVEIASSVGGGRVEIVHPDGTTLGKGTPIKHPAELMSAIASDSQ